MRVLAALAFVAVLSCATAAAPNSLVRHKRLVGLGNLGGLLNNLLSPVVDTVGGVLAPVNDVLGPVLQPVLEAVSNLLDNLLEALQQLVQALTGLLRRAGILPQLADVVDTIIPTVEAALSGLGNGNLAEALAPVVVLVGNLLNGVLETVDDANLPLISDIARALSDILLGAFEAAAETIFRNILQNLPNLPINLPLK